MGAINSGDLGERVTLLTTATALPDGRGGYIPSAPDKKLERWARVRPLNTSEKLRLGQTVDANSYEVTLRNNSDASAKQRLVWKGQTMNVQGETLSENREYVKLICINGGQ